MTPNPAELAAMVDALRRIVHYPRQEQAVIGSQAADMLRTLDTRLNSLRFSSNARHSITKDHND